MYRFIFIFSIIAFFMFKIGFAQEINGWKLSGQLQLRSEIDGRDFNNSTHPLTYASLRTRLGVSKNFADRVQFFVQFQDSRVFGVEQGTLSAINNIDLHQGYVTLIKPFNIDVNVQAGRFEVAYGTERFFGAVDWHYIGRAFDGVRFEIAPSSFPFDLFALTIAESNGYIANPNPFIYDYPAIPTPAHSVYGLYKIFKLTDKSRFDLLGYYENDRFKTNQGDNRLKMFTFAGTYSGTYDKFSSILEAAYQFGKMGDLDISSYLFSLSGHYSLDQFVLAAGVDILSGTDSDSENFNTFLATYGTNHKFYGFMDYFINIPGNTLFGGLNDFYGKIRYRPSDLKFMFEGAFHYFVSNKPRILATPESPDGIEQNTFGQELDLIAKYDFVEGTSITWGGCLFFPGDLMKSFFTPGGNTAFWTYVMITSNI